MLSVEFLENVADFYGGYSVDELAERLGLSSEELMEELEPLIDAHLDLIMEEMDYDVPPEDDEELSYDEGSE